MDLTREQKKLITMQHDTFVKEYNSFLEEIAELMKQEKTVEQALILSELRAHTVVIKQNLESLAALLDRLGWWHRTYRTSKDVRKEAAARPIVTN